jgi:hypothetical protein
MRLFAESAACQQLVRCLGCYECGGPLRVWEARFHISGVQVQRSCLMSVHQRMPCCSTPQPREVRAVEALAPRYLPGAFTHTNVHRVEFPLALFIHPGVLLPKKLCGRQVCSASMRLPTSKAAAICTMTRQSCRNMWPEASTDADLFGNVLTSPPSPPCLEVTASSYDCTVEMVPGQATSRT